MSSTRIVACCFIAVLISGCAHWQRRQTTHFVMHYEKGSPAERDIDELAVKIEGFHKDATETYDFIPDRKISYYFHNRLPLSFFGSQCWGYIWMDRIHVAYSEKGKDESPHELRHYVLHKINRSAPDFFDEGSAGIGIKIQDKTFHQWVKETAPAKIDLEACIKNPDRFGKPGDFVAYSFCTFLFSKLGNKKYGQFYRRVTKKNYSPVLEELTGMPFGSLEAEWKKLVQAQHTGRKKSEANKSMNHDKQ